jgi:PAS domain S-box-containing protein
MKVRALRWLRSLNARIAATVVLMFLAAVWLLALVQSSLQEARLLTLLAAQHESVAGYIAMDINNKVKLRLDSLDMVAGRFPTGDLHDRRALTGFLAERRAIYTLFDGGLAILGPDGAELLAYYPELVGREATRYADPSLIQAAVSSRAPAVGAPMLDPLLGKPAITMAAPILAEGRVVAVLAGVVTLGADNFLDLVTSQRLGELGDFLVAAPKHAVFVAGSTPAFALKPLPAPGVNALHDRAMAGFEGWGRTISSDGVEHMAAVKRVPVAGWFVVARSPAAEVFAPIRETRMWAWGSATAVSVVVGLLTALFVRRQLSPLNRVAAELGAVARGEAPVHPLPAQGSDEIDCLVDAFNRLQKALQRDEDNLRASEQRFRQMFETNQAVKLIIDPASGCIVEANDAACAFYGWDKSTLLTKHIQEINGLPEVAVKAEMERAKAESRLFFNFRHRLASGEIRDVEVYSGPLRLPDTTLLFSIVHDVTDRIEAQRALTQSREQLQLAIDGSGIGLWDWWVQDGRSVYNERWAGMLGYTLAEMEEFGPDFWESRCHPDDLPAVHAAIERHFHGQAPTYECEYRMRHKSGEWVWILGRGKMVERDSEGRPLRMTGIHVEITARKQLEARLREGENRFRTLANAAPVLIWVSGTSKLFSWFNQVWLDFTGRSLDQEQGMGWTESLHPDDRERCLDVYESHFELQAPFSVEYRLRRRDGEYRWILDTGVPRFDENGDFAGYIGSCVDVSEQRDRDRLIRRQAEDLKRSNAELEQFAYVASHDLRQPLRMVGSFLTLLERRLGDTLDADGKSYLDFAVSGARRMDRLILDLLEYSRVGRQHGPPTETLDLAEVMGDVTSTLAVDIGESGSTVDVRGPLPIIEGNRIECGRLFQNLLANAIKYRRPGVAPQVVVSADETETEWVVSVADNGIGIAPESHQRVFGIFQRLVTQEEYEGTGIGLAVCRKIAEHHGGRIWVASQPDQGSTFSVAFPKGRRQEG